MFDEFDKFEIENFYTKIYQTWPTFWQKSVTFCSFFLKPSEGRLVVLERSELLRPEAHEGAPLLLEARHLAGLGG